MFTEPVSASLFPVSSCIFYLLIQAEHSEAGVLLTRHPPTSDIYMKKILYTHKNIGSKIVHGFLLVTKVKKIGCFTEPVSASLFLGVILRILAHLIQEEHKG